MQAVHEGRGAGRERPVSRKRWPKTVLVTGVVVLAGGGVSVAALGLGGDADTTAATHSAQLPSATSEISRSDLAASKLVAGELGYGDPVTVSGRLPGTVTWLPEPGSTVGRGDTLYKVDNQPVTLMYGSVPMYRDLVPGTEGPDVEQLNDNLRALGYDAPDGDGYTARTAAALRALQKKRGVKTTGELKNGQAAFTSGLIRVAALEAAVGDPANGRILRHTSREKRVSAELGVGDQGLAKKGAFVGVVLPDGTTVTGKVSTVRTVSPPKDDAAQQGGGGEKPQTKVEVEIEIPDQKKLKGLDAATVDVKFISATAQKTMSVPVTALVALPDDGGYAVQVVEGGGRTRTVPVTLGLFAQGRVEITGKGLREGMRVGVPK